MIVGSGNLELADGDVALGEHGCGDILGVTSALAPGTTTMVLSASGDGDDGRSGMGSGGVRDEGEVDALRGQERLQLLAERIRAEPADQRGRCAELRGRDRLVGALAAGKISTALPATVSPTLGCRSAVATTSMLMLPATKTRPMRD